MLMIQYQRNRAGNKTICRSPDFTRKQTWRCGDAEVAGRQQTQPEARGAPTRLRVIDDEPLASSPTYFIKP